jgi:hypothetical protein
MSAHRTPEQIRSQLKHPVVDGDGHWLEYAPVFSEKMRKAAGDKSAEGFLAALRSTTDALKMTPEERRRRRVAMPNFWNRQAENTLDRATAMMPKMLYERLDEIGLDFAIVYPTAGLRLPRIKDDETRRAVIRGYNIVSAEYFSGLEDRLTPAAIIPMHHPEEAIAELEFVTKQLGSFSKPAKSNSSTVIFLIAIGCFLSPPSEVSVTVTPSRTKPLSPSALALL